MHSISAHAMSSSNCCTNETGLVAAVLLVMLSSDVSALLLEFASNFSALALLNFSSELRCIQFEILNVDCPIRFEFNMLRRARRQD